MSNYGNFHNIESATRASSGNIGGSKSISGKKRDVTFSSTFLGNNVGYVTTSTRTDMSQGVIRASGRSTDFSFTGENGFAVVKRNPNDPRSESVFTRSCSFRSDKDGNLVNQSGYHLMGWGLDAQGNPPRDHALLDSLTTIKLNNVKDSSKTTTEMYISANLSAKQAKLKGAGQLFKIDRAGLNANIKDTDVIIPEKALKQGDSFIITSGNKPPRTFVYGGIAISRKIDEAGGIYGKTDIGQQFDIGVADNQIRIDTGLSITYKGVTINLKAKDGNANISEYEFTSLDSLSQAINKIDGLKASIKDKRLLVSADSNDAVTFGNYGVSRMKETLGLIDILPEARLDTFRFSSLQGFKDKINAHHETFGLEATSIKGGLDIHSRVATEGFNMTVSSMGVTRFERATIGDGTEKGRATVFIDSPKHGLSRGDFVKISAGMPQVLEGLYMVTGPIPANSDRFTISVIDNNPANFPVLGVVRVNGDCTWQKVAGSKFPVLHPTQVSAGNVGAVTLTAAINTYANDDVVYISGIGFKQALAGGAGDITVPDGYYIVANANLGAGTFEITPTAIAAHAAAPLAVLGDINIQKIGMAPGGFVPAVANDIGNFNTRAMQTFAIAGAAPAKIRLFVPNNNYAERDYFSMAGLPADGLVIDHMRIRPDMKYQIIARGPDWIEFTTTDADMAVGGVVGGADFEYGDPAVPLIPIDFRINHYAKTCDYLGMQQNKEAFAPTYSKDDPRLSLSSGSHAVDRVISQPTIIVDSLGIEHELMLHFAKLDNNRWAVEIQARKNLDGGFDVITDRNDGFIKAGTLEFNPNGSFAASGGLENIDILWNNGSEANHVNINWAQVADNLNGQSSTGISQKGEYNDIRADGDGYKSGALTSIEIDAAGYIIGAFSNGQNRKLYKIPVATFDNINGLEAGADGAYRATRDSGAYRLKFAGEQGVPNIQSESIEDSNVDVTEALLDLNDIGKYSNANFSALRMQNEAADKAINNLTR